jgi:hypothetical protein
MFLYTSSSEDLFTNVNKAPEQFIFISCMQQRYIIVHEYEVWCMARFYSGKHYREEIT